MSDVGVDLNIPDLKEGDDFILDIEELRSQTNIDGFFGRSLAMKRLSEQIRRVALLDCSVSITGETGVGKEVVARSLHALSMRSEAPFIGVNCAAIPQELADSMIFGHVKGSFTGAINDHVGFLEQAHTGTLFLDEIGDLPPGIQAKLLRFLDDGVVPRIGRSALKSCVVNVRTIIASNRSISDENGGFRKDLFYRLQGFPLQVPSLSERRGDITPLIYYFLSLKSNGNTAMMFRSFEPIFSILNSYDWPGNVRELKNVVDILAEYYNGQLITPERLFEVFPKLNNPSSAVSLIPLSSSLIDFDFGFDKEGSLRLNDVFEAITFFASRLAILIKKSSGTFPLSDFGRKFEEVIVGEFARDKTFSYNGIADKLGFSRSGLRDRVRRLGVLSQNRDRISREFSDN
ncbi:sigma-54-dependent Fis family transcriptional regulator [Candidatus Peregrinibacteria bacterium]|nr:sigma-54-dependent Fis family transcriptional regulator [Candidatus Peregrinibacteria bacterium]